MTVQLSAIDWLLTLDYVRLKPFTAMRSFWKWPIKVQNLKNFSVFVFFLALACERISIKMHSIENRCCRTGKSTVCRHVCASFSPEILQAWTVMPFQIVLDEKNKKINIHLQLIIECWGVIPYIFQPENLTGYVSEGVKCLQMVLDKKKQLKAYTSNSLLNTGGGGGGVIPWQCSWVILTKR